MAKKRSILIVDDDIDASQMAKMLLEKTGLYTVNVCNRGSEAFEAAVETRPEMVLLDIMMPDAHGPDIAAKIQSERSLALTKIVFMTSLVSQDETLGDSVIGGHPFISKPITGAVFLEKIKGFFL